MRDQSFIKLPSTQHRTQAYALSRCSFRRTESSFFMYFVTNIARNVFAAFLYPTGIPTVWKQLACCAFTYSVEIYQSQAQNQ
jgi:hypothetical protein